MCLREFPIAWLRGLLLATTLFTLTSAWAQVAISSPKMNMLYPSVHNPLSVVVSDIPDSNLMLLPSTGRIWRRNPGHYDWTICEGSTATATLTIKDLSADTLIETFDFRIKGLPEPNPVITRHRANTLSRGEFCSSGGLALVILNFDLDFRCETLHYEVQYFPTTYDSVIKKNIGARYNAEVYELVSRGTRGDRYHFFNIAYRCGCDPMVRHLSEELYITIK